MSLGRSCIQSLSAERVRCCSLTTKETMSIPEQLGLGLTARWTTWSRCFTAAQRGFNTVFVLKIAKLACFQLYRHRFLQLNTQRCRVLRPRYSCTVRLRSASVIHRLVVSRICEKRRGRAARRRIQCRENTKRRAHVLRIESARLAMRAARTLRLAARAERYIPPSKAS